MQVARGTTDVQMRPLTKALAELFQTVTAYHCKVRIGPGASVVSSSPSSLHGMLFRKTGDCQTNGLYWKWAGRLPNYQLKSLEQACLEHVRQRSMMEQIEMRRIIKARPDTSLNDHIAQYGRNMLPAERKALIKELQIIRDRLLAALISKTNEYSMQLSQSRLHGVPRELLPKLSDMLIGRDGAYLKYKSQLPIEYSKSLLHQCEKLLEARSNEEEQTIQTAFSNTERNCRTYLNAARLQGPSSAHFLAKLAEYEQALYKDMESHGLNILTSAQEKLQSTIEGLVNVARNRPLPSTVWTRPTAPGTRRRSVG